MRCHQRLEEAAMVRNLEVQELVHDDEVLKGVVLIVEVDREGDGVNRRAKLTLDRRPILTPL
jgi:hypothetical protein